MRWLLVLVAFAVVPLAELWAILSVGQLIGAGWTILLLLADSVLGAALLRAQGRGAWHRFASALHSGRVPSRELADGLLIVVGGALLLTPGFLTDVLGLLMLLPPTRALGRRLLERTIARRMMVGLAGGAAAAAAPGGSSAGASEHGSRRAFVSVHRRPRARSPFDVEGSATDYGHDAADSRGAGDGERARLER